MIKEDIHEKLVEIYDEFDRHSRITNTQYSIDADYPTVQGYRVISCSDFDGFLRHILNFIKDKDVDLDIDDQKIVYDDINEPDFMMQKSDQPIFKFTLAALNEAQYKSPTTSYTRKQAPFRSSFRQNKPGFTYENGSKKKKSKKKKKKMSESFGEKLDSTLAENLSLSFSEPNILFTKSNAIDQTQDPNVYLKSASDSIKQALDNFHYALSNIDDDTKIGIINNAIEMSTQQANLIRGLIDNEQSET